MIRLLPRGAQSTNNVDQIEKNPLTPAQRRAVVINEDCNLVVAAAGSGKTSVIVAKEAYLLWRQLRRPDEILMLAFNKHAAVEIQDRLKERIGSPIAVRTFHALGYAIIKKVEGKPPPLSKVAGDDMARQKLVRRLIEQLIQEDKAFERIISDWFQSYFAPYQSEWDFKSQGEYWRYVRDNNIRTLTQ